LVEAGDEVTASAALASKTGATEVPDRDALADLPAGYCVAHGIDFSNDFVAGDAWIGDAGKEPFDGENI